MFRRVGDRELGIRDTSVLLEIPSGKAGVPRDVVLYGARALRDKLKEFYDAGREGEIQTGRATLSTEMNELLGQFGWFVH